MNKPLLFFLALAFLSITAKAQDFGYGTFNNDDLSLKKYPGDTTAHAFVINEFGVTHIDVLASDYSGIIYEYHVKIKILDDKGFDKGTVEIPFRQNNTAGHEETVSDIKGVTTYIDDDGNVKRSELDPKSVFTVAENKYWNNAKFTMPNLRKGCIIEYKYRFTSPYWDRFPNWEFQSDIPKKYSEYNVHIPAFWVYNASIRGVLKLTKTPLR